MYYNDLITSSTTKSKTSWNIINSEIGTASNKRHTQTEFNLGSKTININQAAKTFNSYLINLVYDLITQDSNSELALSSLRESFPYEFPQITNIPISEAEVTSTTSSLKNKTSCGYDGLSNKILKLCGSHISKPLNYVFNISLTSGICPDRLKYAIIKPCFKKGDKSQISNYRPISILTGFSKIFKLLIFHRLKQHLVGNNILVTEQYGIRDNVSTESAIFKLIESMFSAWNNKELITGIFCDLTRAFNCISHQLLISKLEFYGVKGPILNWLQSYLYNRKQRVELQFISSPYILSNWEIVRHGVPQGSVLGPLFFNVYTNDFPCIISKVSDIILFADDTNILISSNNFTELHSKLNAVLRCIPKWFQNNQLVLNLNKTHLVKFISFKSPSYPLYVSYNKHALTVIENIRFLGLYLDCHLT
ncbi:hypothetical protein Cfor_07998 [Coptotermes formosanus]|jgi:hypothetical protein|uniref:Reverse transcriptase domain-containing protein n=1 Tax=Coptotermes formosanus TaxID=36987 RepID=A0A6L2Q829_COPFO|nr:hypothetical protein Cfor_07998 [Coptotermes formosanus]